MAAFDSHQHRRRSIRHRAYDYTEPGAYFVTICTHRRDPLLATVVGNDVTLSAHGETVATCWEDLLDHFSYLELDAFVVMPNHIHAVIVLHDEPPCDQAAVVPGAGFKPALPTRHALTEIVRALKTFSARRINAARGTPGARVWQRGYYEHIVRDDAELARIREYIVNNPANWASDEYHVA